jgi:hypothetical protein
MREIMAVKGGEVKTNGKMQTRAIDGQDFGCGAGEPRSSAGGRRSWRLHGFGQAATDWAKNEGGHGALRGQREVGGFARELGPLVQPHACFAQELRGKAHVFGAVNTPKPKLLFVALEEVERFLKLLHGAIEGRGEKEDTERPSMPRIVNPNADAVLATLVLLDAAAVVVADGRCTSWHVHSPIQTIQSLGAEGHESLRIGFQPGQVKRCRLAMASLAKTHNCVRPE